MDKRTLLAVVLSMAVLMIFQFIYKPAPVVIDNTSVDNVASVDKADSENLKADVVETQTKSLEGSHETAVKNFEVETDNLIVYFNENTGNINSVRIKNFEHAGIAPQFQAEKGDYLKVNTLNVKPTKSKIYNNGDKKIVEFDYEKNNVIVSRQYIIDQSYLITVKESLANISDSSIRLPYDVAIGPGLGQGFVDSKYLFSGPMAYDGKKVKQQKPNKIDKDIEVKDAEWLGYTSKYFAFIKVNTDVKNAIFKKYNDSAIVKSSAEIILNPKSKDEKSFILFVGPKKYDLLSSYGYDLEKSIDFGVFSFLAIPMLKVMNIFYGATKNYGWAIILLTIIIKIITYPLTYKSMSSMKKMKDLQPKMTEIKEKFKGDAQKMNAAMMELYKKHGVNPMGGCLPMLIQIPIFFALYKALLVSIELKGAPFIFWLADLSEKDPYYITPILMGASMFFQQKLTPAAGDPIQQKLFLFMPVIFTFMFLNFPSGLVIYWLTNNILSIGQQIIINKKTA
ncbi:membrane protein insertase YidC [Deferribacteraceae bacterium V6Fe1]|nr:membrane protein insertase YidC [Deferribacteraceae bacterium V6Fe1]